MSDSAGPPKIDALLAHQGWVRALALNLAGGDPERADDLVQETWLTALRRGPRRAANLRGWLAQVMRNVRRQDVRGDERRGQREHHAARPETTPSTEEIVERAALHRRIVDAVWSLDEPYRTAMILRYFEDLPPREVAERLGVNVHTVQTRVERARHRLRALLDRHYGGRAAWTLLVVPGLGVEAAAATGAAAAGSGGAGTAAIAKGVVTMKLGVKLASAAAVLVVATMIGITISSDGDPELTPEKRPAVDASARNGQQEQPAAEPSRDRQASNAEAAAVHASPPVSIAASPTKERAPRKYSVAGTVTDLEGMPLAGATVRAFGWRPYQSVPRLLHAVTTDEEGRYYLGPVEREMLLEATASGYCRARVIAWPWNERDFRLGRGGILTGRVKRAKTDASCVDAIVAVFNPSRKVEHYAGQPMVAWAEAEVGADGCYRFTDLPPGRYTCKIYPRDSNWVAPKDAIEVMAGRTTTHDVVLPFVDAVAVRGIVTDRKTGQPIANARVFTPGNDRRSDATDENGAYEIRGIARFCTVRAEADGYHAVWRAVRGTPPLDIERDFALDRTGSISGRALDPAGQPVENACVAFSSSDAIELNWRYLTRTDASGRFTLDHVPPKRKLRVHAGAEGMAPGRSDAELTLSPGQAVTGLEIRLSRGGTVSGQVVDASGRPASGVELRLVRLQKGTLPGGAAATAKAQEGRYAFTPVTAGRYRIIAVQPGEILDEIEITEESRSIRNLQLKRTGGTLVIEGRLQTPDGKPVAGVGVLARPVTRGGPSGQALTDPDGNFSIRGLTAGMYDLRHQSAHHESVKQRLAAGSRSVVLRLVKKPSFAIRVVRADNGQPVEQFWYTYTDLAFRHRVTAPDGRYEMPPYVLRMKHFLIGTEDGLISARLLEIPKVVQVGGMARVIRLIPGGMVMGRVLAPDGGPVPNASVRIADLSSAVPESRFGMSARTDGAGRFAFRPLRPGAHLVRVTHPDWIGAERKIGVASGATSEPEIQLARGGALRIRVVAASGEPVKYATIRLEPSVPKFRYISTRNGGRCHLTGLAPGQYVVRVGHRSWAPARVVATVLRGSDTPLIVRMSTGGTLRVTAVDPQGRPVTDAAVAVTDAGGTALPSRANGSAQEFARLLQQGSKLTYGQYRSKFARTDAAGLEVRQHIPAGRITIAVSKSGYQSVTVVVEVANGRTTPVPVTLKPER